MKFDVDQLLANLIDARKVVKSSLDELDQRIEETRQFKRFAVRPIEVTVYKSDSVVETNRFIPNSNRSPAVQYRLRGTGLHRPLPFHDRSPVRLGRGPRR